MAINAAALVSEIVDFVSSPKTKPVGGDDMKILGQRRYIEFPANLGTAAEFA